MSTTKTGMSMKTMTIETGVRKQDAHAVPAITKRAWHEHHFRAMNTTIHLTHYGRNSQMGGYVESFFEQSERRLSRFRSSSELSRLNENDETDCRVSAELFSVLEAAQWATQSTDGLFDPTILADLERAGYDRSFERVQHACDAMEPMDERPAPQNLRNMQTVKLNYSTHGVTRPAGLRLDLGGIGKGWTVDRCADFLHLEGPFLLNAGGDLYAYGSPGGASGWEIEIEDALQPENSVATLSLTNSAVATSTIIKRSWLRGGQRMHHIIDPRTGRSASTDLMTVSVVAPRVSVAEVYAKSALILGSRSGLTFLNQRGVDGILQAEDGTIHATHRIMERLALPSQRTRIQEAIIA